MLAPGGTMLLEVGMGQAPAVAALLAASGLVGVSAHDDLAGVPRVVVGVAPVTGASCGA
jgi:release factor glutamine methyltransferase